MYPRYDRLAPCTSCPLMRSSHPKSGSSKTNEIVFKNKLGLKEFFYVAQDKMARDAKDTLIKDIVPIVRQLDRRSRMQFVQLLVFKLESVMEEQAPPELDGDILDKKGYQSQDVDVLFSASLKRKLFRTLSQPDGLAASELGYMINAPFDILGTIPPVLKPSVWPWSAQVSFISPSEPLNSHNNAISEKEI